MAQSIFIPSGGGATPGGASGTVQFNNTGALGGFGLYDGSELILGGTPGTVPSFVVEDWQGFAPFFLGNVGGYAVIPTYASKDAGGIYGLQAFLYRGTDAAPTASVDGDRTEIIGMNAYTGSEANEVGSLALTQVGDWPTPSFAWTLSSTVSGSGAVLTLPANGTAATTDQLPLSGTTGSIGGSLLATIGATVTGTATVAGAVVGSPVAVSASDGTLPNGLVVLSAAVTSADTVTVQLSALAAVTPAAKTYNVRVIQ